MGKNRNYAKGREYEYQFLHKVNNTFEGEKIATRVLLSGQRGEGDVLIALPNGATISAEIKARKAVPKVVYEWLGKHDLLVMKKIGQQYGWLVTMSLDHYLWLLSTLIHTLRTPRTADNTASNVGEGQG